MKLSCKSCGAAIAAANIDLHTGLAKCGYCNSVMLVRDELEAGGERATEVPSAPRVRGEVPRPSRWDVRENFDDLIITYRWFKAQAIFLAFFCVTWDSFLIFWYYIAFSLNGVPWLMIVFPVVHVAVGVGLTYSTLAMFVNRTVVSVNPSALRIRHGPMPWFGNRALDPAQISQLCCREVSQGNKNGTAFQYAVEALLVDRSKIALLKGFTDPQEALYVEQRIEDWLGIEDRPVPGELPRE